MIIRLSSICFILLLGLLTSVKAGVYDLYANDGSYLGNTSSNMYDSNSINNPYGQYGSQYSQASIRNSYGSYGSQYSSTSPNNSFALPGTAVPQYGGLSKPFGGSSRY